MIIEGLIKRIRSLNPKRGDLNYVVTRLVLESLKPDAGWSYHSLSDCVSVLKDAAAEIERRLLGPYEDTAIEKNGDMNCFNEQFAYDPQKSAYQYGTLNCPVTEWEECECIAPAEACTDELPPIAEAMTNAQYVEYMRQANKRTGRDMYSEEEFLKVLAGDSDETE